MINVLLLSAGTNACYHFARILKTKFPNKFNIVGTDINERYLISTCIYLDKFYKVPYCTEKNYYKTIIEICQNEKIDYILPSFDKDQMLFYPENNDLVNIGVKSFGTNKKTLKIYKDKISMNEFLRKNKFNIPEHFNLNELIDNNKYFIKPMNGVGSIDTKIINGHTLKNQANQNIIIQEICNTPEITLECFNYNGTLRTIARERIDTKSGVCTKARIFNSPELNKIATKFIEKVKTPYYFNLQFMKNNKDKFVITDVNFRLAGGMSLSYTAGWDEVSALANIMLKKNSKTVLSTLPETIQPQYVLRAYTDIVTKVGKPVVAFDLDGTLLDSRERHKIVLNDVLKKYNIVLETSDLIKYKRHGRNNVDYLISKGIKKDLANSIQKAWITNIEHEKYLSLDKLYPDANKLIEKYSKDNDLILITARSNKTGTKNQIKKLGLINKFKNIYIIDTGKNVSQEKAKILQKQNATLMIGDTLSDLNATQIAGIEFLFRKNGFWNGTI